MGWSDRLRGDPLPWLLAEDTPAVRNRALVSLLDRAPDDAEVVASRAAAMRSDPIAAILAAQHPDGYWVKPGAGYAPKYRGTVWQLVFLDQLGADPADPRVQAACSYLLDHAVAGNGGFGMYGGLKDLPPDAGVVHCLNGNLLRALIGFGRLDDRRVQGAIEWQARAITGDDFDGWQRRGTSGPGFACAINGDLPCAWGAIKALLGLARIPPGRRQPVVSRAIGLGAKLLLDADLAAAAYPAGPPGRVSSLWFELGFPSGYSADILQALEVLVELGWAGDPRLRPAIDWLVGKQDEAGRWRNEQPFRGRTWAAFDRPNQPSKWITLRALAVLRAVEE